MEIELLLMLSGLVNRLVEGVKRVPVFDRIPDDWRDEVLLVTSWTGGIITVVAFAPDANLIAGSGVPEWAGTLFTGVIVGTGANAINWFTKLAEQRVGRAQFIAIEGVEEFDTPKAA